MNFDYPEGATPLDPDEAQGLLLTHITTRSELDRWEQENITEAEVPRLISGKLSVENLDIQYPPSMTA